MPNKRSAEKALRVSERRRLRNRSIKAGVKTFVRKAERAVAGGEAETVDAVRIAVSALDRAARKDVLHPNNVARRKSRLMKKLNALGAAGA